VSASHSAVAGTVAFVERHGYALVFWWVLAEQSAATAAAGGRCAHPQGGDCTWRRGCGESGGTASDHDQIVSEDEESKSRLKLGNLLFAQS
jgi:hypothetical protein